MKTSHYQILLFIVFPLMGLFYSCVKSSPCPKPPPKTKYLGSKAYIPYTGYDTITFIRTLTGDTHTFIGQGIHQQFDTSSYSIDDECWGKELVESITYGFGSSTFPTPIIFRMYYSDQYERFYINFDSLIFDNDSYYLGKYIYDSIQVRNKYYYKATQLYESDNPKSKAYYILYNKQNGILKFKFKTGEVWERLSK